VEEFLIVDPQARSVEWFTQCADSFAPADGSAILGITSADLHGAIDWPT
jgi:hypothetical protein